MDTTEFKPLGERVAVLETKVEEIKGSLDEIRDKLDELLQLKAKGMGALSLIGMLVGSGIIGAIALIAQFFARPHL